MSDAEIERALAGAHMPSCNVPNTGACFTPRGARATVIYTITRRGLDDVTHCE